MDKEGAINIDDAAGFFANVFGGERFMEYVSLIVVPTIRRGKFLPLSLWHTIRSSLILTSSKRLEKSQS